MLDERERVGGGEVGIGGGSGIHGRRRPLRRRQILVQEERIGGVVVGRHEIGRGFSVAGFGHATQPGRVLVSQVELRQGGVGPGLGRGLLDSEPENIFGPGLPAPGGGEGGQPVEHLRRGGAEAQGGLPGNHVVLRRRLFQGGPGDEREADRLEAGPLGVAEVALELRPLFEGQVGIGPGQGQQSLLEEWGGETVEPVEALGGASGGVEPIGQFPGGEMVRGRDLLRLGQAGREVGVAAGVQDGEVDNAVAENAMGVGDEPPREGLGSGQIFAVEAFRHQRAHRQRPDAGLSRQLLQRGAGRTVDGRVGGLQLKDGQADLVDLVRRVEPEHLGEVVLSRREAGALHRQNPREALVGHRQPVRGPDLIQDAGGGGKREGLAAQRRFGQGQPVGEIRLESGHPLPPAESLGGAVGLGHGRHDPSGAGVGLVALEDRARRMDGAAEVALGQAELGLLDRPLIAVIPVAGEPIAIPAGQPGQQDRHHRRRLPAEQPSPDVRQPGPVHPATHVIRHALHALHDHTPPPGGAQPPRDAVPG